MLDLQQQQQLEGPPAPVAAPYRYSLKHKDLIYDATGPSSLYSNHHQDPRQAQSASNVDLLTLGGAETSVRQSGSRGHKHVPLRGRGHIVKHHHHTATSRRNSATAIAASAASALDYSSSLAAAAAVPLAEDSRLLDAADATSSRKKSGEIYIFFFFFHCIVPHLTVIIIIDTNE